MSGRSQRTGSDVEGETTQEKALTLLQEEGQNVMDDLEQQIDAAWASGNHELAVELRDAWFAIARTKVTFSRGSYFAETTTRLLGRNGHYSVTGVSMDFNANRVMGLYRNGDIADTSIGYFVDIPSGRQGIRELLVHEARHGTVSNYLDSGREMTRPQREHDADAFIEKVYR